MHFTALGYSRSDGQTSDHFTDVASLQYEEEFLKYIPDAFSPVGIMLDEWGNDIATGTNHDFKVIAVNDLEPEWKGKIKLQILNGETMLTEKTQDFDIPSFGQDSIIVSLTTPDMPGTYTVIASIEKDNEKPVKSIREIPFIKGKPNR
jgi:hypothetical protein